MQVLFDEFIRERRYLRNLSEETLIFYQNVYHVFDLAGTWDNLSKKALTDTLIGFRERGVRIGAINSYIRGVNVFLNWLHENNHAANLSLKLLKGESRVLRPLSEADLKTIIRYKPQTPAMKRLHTILLLIMDTGIRIDEAITLQRSKIDFDNLLLAVIGKGNKERVLPFSYELRKKLYKYLKGHKFELVFCTRDGGLVGYDNIRRDYSILMKELKITTDAAFHSLRRTFATQFIKQGGNPLILQRMLGHSTLQQTNVYVKLANEDLRPEQLRTSILSRLR